MVKVADVSDVSAALAAHEYVADEGLATAIFLALRLGRPLLLEGEAGRRQDRGGQGARPLDRRRARPPPVLRGHRRRPGRLRVGLLAPAAAPACRRGRRRPGRTRTSSTPSGSSCAARCSPAIAERCRAPAGAPRRRDRPRRRRVRGVPARDPLRLLDHRARARHVPCRGPAGRRRHVEPHPRRPRRAEASLPLPLDRAPRLRARARDPAGEGAARARGARPPGRRCGRVAARARALQAARRRRDDRLGPGAGRARAAPSSTTRTVDATLGTVLKYREDQERVRSAGVGRVVEAAQARG